MGIFRNMKRCEKKTRRNNRYDPRKSKRCRAPIANRHEGRVKISYDFSVGPSETGIPLEMTIMGHYVEWKPFYSVGDAAIDDEHKRLLAIIDDLYVAIQMGHGHDRVQDVLERLNDYTMIHFDHEERAMRACGYPDVDAHKTMHDEMRRRASEFRENPNAISDKDLLQFLKSWWVRHIQNQDKAYGPYLDAIARHPIKMA
jgi:hemerythrin